jgi:AraC-like DNA-binding protein
MQLDNFRVAHLRDLDELEGGVYWPRLQPYFLKPYFRRLTYQLLGNRPKGCRPGEVLSTRGASGVGELDVAYVADRCPTVMKITGTGLPDYCLTLVSRGSLACLGTSTPGSFEAHETIGLIYRGLPGMTLSASPDHERLAIWIPAASLQQRVAGLLGDAAAEDIAFDPIVDFRAASGQRIKRLVRFLMEEFGDAHPFAGSDITCKSFTDMLLYSMLQTLPHNHSDRLARPASSPVPGTVRRAEDYIRSHAAEPIALHEVAEAAGCSVRSLQLGFKQFRDITPTTAITRARLEAVRQALNSGEVAGTITDVALQYGFSNPGRLSKPYKMTFGVSPADELRRLPARPHRRR